MLHSLSELECERRREVSFYYVSNLVFDDTPLGRSIMNEKPFLHSHYQLRIEEIILGKIVWNFCNVSEYIKMSFEDIIQRVMRLLAKLLVSKFFVYFCEKY